MGYILIMIVAVLAILLFIVIESAIERRTIELCHYHVKSNKFQKDSKLTFVTVADLHSKDFGDKNSPLIHAIKEETPDGILIPGDLIIGKKKEDCTVALNLLSELTQIAPVFYSLGNHEQRMKSYLYNEITGEYDTDLSIYSEPHNSSSANQRAKSKYEQYKELIEQTGARVLDNEMTTMDIKGEKINFIGLSISLDYFEKFNHQLMKKEEVSLLLEKGLESAKKEGALELTKDDTAFKILLAHNPVHMEAYASWGADLTVSGHLHGGIIRIPFLGGIITPQVKLLPEYSAGLYKVKGKAAVVSRGLGEHTVNVRVCNPPELSVIHITR